MSIVPQLIANTLITGSIYALLAMGFTLTYDSAKFPNLAHAAQSVIGGYAVFFFANQLGINLYLSAGLGIITAATLGWLFDRVVFRTLRKRKATGAVSLIAALGLAIMVEAACAILFTSQYQTLASNIKNQKIFLVGDAAFTQVQLVAFALSILVLLLIMLMLKYTELGKALRAVSDDAEVAKIVGINTERVLGWVFFISAAVAGLAGIMVGLDTGLQPTMGLFLLISSFGGAVIGGVGNVYGAFLGGFIISFLENFLIWKIPAEWKGALVFIVIILFLLFRPQGLFKK